MKEYTILAVCSSVVVIVLDTFVLKTRLPRTRSFWTFLLVMVAFKLIVNGYLTWRPIVLYGEEYNIGIRIITIPVEDFIYGFGLVSLSVVVWEYFKRNSLKESSRHPNEKMTE